MASAELRRLHKLHLIDLALLEIRKRAAALDPGRKTAAEIATLQKQADESPGKKLQTELIDLELQQKSFDDKLKKYDKELYSGKVVNPREVEAIQKEIAMLKKQRGNFDERILEIWEELPKAKKGLEQIEFAIAERKGQLAKQHQAALQEKSKLEAEFKQRSTERPVAAKEISPGLLARYEGARQKHGGVGMGEVAKNKTCAACGTHLPERVIQGLKEDKMITCESCHRILYYSEGIV